MHYFLQEVVRNWYARNPNIVETENALVILAQECAHSFIDGKFISSNYIIYKYTSSCVWKKRFEGEEKVCFILHPTLLIYVIFNFF